MNCKIPAAFLLLALAVGVSCRTRDPLPRVDVSAAGWSVRQGQAVWTPAKHRPELAGDLLLATNVNGNFFVQFSKIPFSFATAEVVDGRWRAEFAGGKYSRQGLGPPPARFVWFQLPSALLAGKAAAGWRFEARTTNSWRLENPYTGEILEGEFFP